MVLIGGKVAFFRSFALDCLTQLGYLYIDMKRDRVLLKTSAISIE